MNVDLLVPIFTLVSLVTSFVALVLSAKNNKRQHELASSVAKTNARLEALRLAKHETEELHHKLRSLLKNTQTAKHCIDTMLVQNHPARPDALDQLNVASKDLDQLYAGSLGQLPEDVRKWCHGLKNSVREVKELTLNRWEFDPAKKLDDDTSLKMFIARRNISDHQRLIEGAIRGLDRKVADRLLEYLEGG